MEFKITEMIPDATIIHHIDGDGGVWATSGRRIIFRNDGDWQRKSHPFLFRIPGTFLHFQGLQPGQCDQINAIYLSTASAENWGSGRGGFMRLRKQGFPTFFNSGRLRPSRVNY